jgi:CHAD domain-containing protein
VVTGLRATYREARRGSRAAKRSKAWFHTWRRRSKELVYQLEVIAGHAGTRAAELHAEVSGVTDMLSPAVDLIMVRDFVATYDQGIAPEAVAKLRVSIEHQLGDRMKTARKAARDAFRKRPKQLAKRLTKSVRRDLEPSAEVEPVDAKPREESLPQ